MRRRALDVGGGDDAIGRPVLEALGVQDLVDVVDAQRFEAVKRLATHTEPGAWREGVDGTLREDPAVRSNALEQQQGLPLEHAGFEALAGIASVIQHEGGGPKGA